MRTFLRDLFFGYRILRKSPGFTMLAIVILAIGISASTAVFCSVDAIVLHPFAYEDQDDIVVVWEKLNKMPWGKIGVSPALLSISCVIPEMCI